MSKARLLATVCALALLCAPAFGQSGEKTELPARLKHTAKIEKYYDRFTGDTSYFLKLMKVSGEQFDGLFLHAHTRVAVGEKSPRVLLFGLSVISPRDVRAVNATLYALIDGERKDFGELTFISSDRVGFVYSVMYGVILPPGPLDRLATAKRVEMRFDGVEFELTEDHRNALADFLAYARGD